MITPNDLLTASDEELPKMLGQVLQPDYCLECLMEPDYCEKNDFCKEQNYSDIPIDDWNIAMKWRDWAVEECGEEAFIEALRMSFMGIGCDCIDVEIPDESVLKWASLDALPKHYLQTAALCKLNQKKAR